MYESHTPYEWAMQRAMAIVEPFGEARADVRAAKNTVAAKALTAENVDEIYAELTNYTGDDAEDPDEIEADPDILAELENNQ